MRAEISIAEFWLADPPRTRVLVITSPSRVIALTDESARSARWASSKSSTATTPAKRCGITSEISFDVTSDASEVNPDGVPATPPAKPPSTTNSSDCPALSRLSMVRAETAEEISETTIESASGPSAAATAASHPLVTVMSEAKRPRTFASLRPERIASEPSRCNSDSLRATNRASSPERERCAVASSARVLACSASISASVAFAFSKSASSEGSVASRPAIFVSRSANSSWKFCKRAAASSRDLVKRVTSAFVASMRERSPLI